MTTVLVMNGWVERPAQNWKLFGLAPADEEGELRPGLLHDTAI